MVTKEFICVCDRRIVDCATCSSRDHYHQGNEISNNDVNVCDKDPKDSKNTEGPKDQKDCPKSPEGPKDSKKESPPRLPNTQHRILNNKPIDVTLHCVTMISNPILFKRRYELALEFIKNFEKYPGVALYVVEVLYEGQTPAVTDKKNPRHLQVFTKTEPLWHKENALNIGIQKLLPKDWRAVAWIDADISFENPCWALDTLKLLNDKDPKGSVVPTVCQLFSHALDLNKDKDPMTIFQSFGHEHYHGKAHGRQGLLFHHPGFAWACNRQAYDKMNSCGHVGLYDYSILGSGDQNMAMSLIKKCQGSHNNSISENYKKSIADYQKSIEDVKLCYTPGVIKHYFHGSKVNRKYVDRWKILVKYQYDPYLHVTKDSNGLLVPTKDCPKGLLDDIYKYFAERNEDE
jgi:hypothetical protein